LRPTKTASAARAKRWRLARLEIGNHETVERILLTSETGDEDADQSAEQKFFNAARPEAHAMLTQVHRVLRMPFLSGVASDITALPLSQVFRSHPHYATFAKMARHLNGGLALEGGLLQIGVKQVWLLYQYWCFLRIITLLRERLQLEQLSLVQLSRNKISVSLKKGVESSVVFRNPVSGKRVEVIFERSFTRLPTISQRPDNVIQLASEDRLFIFDAKYRLAFDPSYLDIYGGIGPQVEDINTMHRYRDAIMVRGGEGKARYVSVVRGAAVLFPFHDEETYRNHRFYQSIDQVEIGGLPFMPGATKLVEEMILRLLKSEGLLAESDAATEL